MEENFRDDLVRQSQDRVDVGIEISFQRMPFKPELINSGLEIGYLPIQFIDAIPSNGGGKNLDGPGGRWRLIHAVL